MAFDQIKLEKGMYREAGKSFSQVLEQLDPSEAYKGTPLEGTDAFQRQLKRFGIRVRGKNSDTVEKFFSTSGSSVLFPEYVSRVVRQGMEEDDILSMLVATTTNIDAMDYRSISAISNDADLEPARVGEGAAIPGVTLTASDKLTKLYKRGRMLLASYEALRFQRLDLFSVFLRQMGNAIQRTHVKDALQTLLYGDGEMEPIFYEAGDDTIGGDDDELSYAQLVHFWSEFNPYKMTTLLMPPKYLHTLLQMSQMQDAAAGLSFHGTGKLITPLGAQLLPIPAATIGDNIVGIDQRYALELVRCGDVTVEFDKLIDRQLERAAITSIAGFNLMCCDAVKVIEYAA